MMNANEMEMGMNEIFCEHCGKELGPNDDYELIEVRGCYSSSEEPWCRSCLDERGPDEKAVEDMLIQLISAAKHEDAICGDVDLSGANVKTFDQIGLLTHDCGVVLRLVSGQEFQITVVKSK